jgi:elongation of very long chain fatty acids protein 4
MMYSYYTLSLLKVSCPWKRYLTQAQLLQFTTVLIYSACTCYILFKRKNAESIHFLCVAVQVFEMTSLFVLFMHFYSKSYKNKKQSPKKASSDSDSATDSVPEQGSISSESSDEAKKFS